jgi:integrase/recombinase XerC
MGKTIYLANFASDKFSALLERFHRHLLESDRAKSAKAYLTDIRMFAEWMQDQTGNFSVRSITPLDIVEYRQHLQDENRAPTTINRKLTSLKLFFKWLCTQGEITDNPAEDVKFVAVGNRQSIRWLNRNQQAALMRAVREKGNLRDEAIIGLMLHAGLRVSEVSRLTKEDLYIGERSGRVIVRAGKGNKYREVPLNKTIRKILARWLSENKSECLFPNRYGSQISVRGIYDLVAEYAYLARLENVSPHTLRHTFCKNSIDMGIPIDQVAIMAGHSKLDITKRYTLPSLQDLQAAVERLAWE